MRGRIQVEWRCANQTRANTQRDWLNLQLTGRGYISEVLPKAELNPIKQVWLTTADLAFDTTAEGQTIQTLVLARQAADPFILASSWSQYHNCDHEDGSNNCVLSSVKTVK